MTLKMFLVLQLLNEHSFFAHCPSYTSKTHDYLEVNPDASDSGSNNEERTI